MEASHFYVPGVFDSTPRITTVRRRHVSVPREQAVHVLLPSVLSPLYGLLYVRSPLEYCKRPLKTLVATAKFKYKTTMSNPAYWQLLDPALEQSLLFIQKPDTQYTVQRMSWQDRYMKSGPPKQSNKLTTKLT